jgi:hypothetical protein
MTTNPGETRAYSIACREQALDVMADYPDYGEQRWYTEALSAERSRSAGGECHRVPVVGAATATATPDRRRSTS